MVSYRRLPWWSQAWWKSEERKVSMRASARALVAWCLWAATMSACAAGLVVTLVVTRPLTAGVLVEGAAFAVAFPLGYATIGLVLGLRRPANPIGWLFATSGPDLGADYLH
jgi:hypothetical protein